MKSVIAGLLVVLCFTGCSIVPTDMFPKFTWYWSRDAKMYREQKQQEQEYQRTNHVHTISAEPWVQESAWDNHWDLIYQDPKVKWRQLWVKLNATNRLEAVREAKQWFADNP